VIRQFKDKGSEDLFNGRASKAARKVCPVSLWPIVFRKLDLLDSVASLNDLLVPPGNMLEALKGDRLGQYSIRVKRQYRICFNWNNDGPDNVEVVDYH
jgi:toxin HigB-1